MSPGMMTHHAGSPFRELPSFACPKKVLKRMAGLLELKPDCPPSPQIVIGHTTPEPPVSQVPLSCVPPWMFFGSVGLTEKLWNWSVDSPLFRLVSFPGTRDSSCWQSARLAPVSPRVAHSAEVSTNSPLERTRPPSEPKKATFGFDGTVTIACWSGCIPFGNPFASAVASRVTSEKLTPASVE